ncbi:hypothetical protein EMIHUDRAFT_211526 [Emiliania huxleyi CCMP1516]|uniref:AAA+ ATPase domain-containing protein n=2 Tax=Emiliania huxleyi TaxID=2903 RepID=A0A0D3IVS4_EMIH1|nr:hypothetical protein EMIHUDRAFT_211526 [Emiliania huxleyi CCMP1516]EOD15359.1 hypothetical protein EMIHUDRAFT_211526 [Emiliania huxleyi CCMP1516]|eukprot:XP_005767788.1 hypothetical protein EMIHUDRAFT_211526 [Emiliania huxleyi CCMP1516]
MHKKKVEELRQWLATADASLQLGLPPSPRMLVLSGPPGCAKSTALRVLAGEAGFEICEWLEGRALRWVSEGERAGAGPSAHTGYESRLSQFAHFLSSSLRTLSLSIAAAGPARGGGSESGEGAGGSGASTPTAAVGLRRRLVLLEELPVGSSSGARTQELLEQQRRMLRSALETARFPVALVLCSDASVSTAKQLETLLGPAAACPQLTCHVACNPVADTLLTRALRSVAAAEGVSLAAEQLTALARASNGDLRHALNRPSGGGADRDRFRDLFHTVGKLLHAPAQAAKAAAAAKGAEAAGGAGDAARWWEQEQENARAACDNSAALALSFLQQNYLPHFGDIEDAALAADAMSDAAHLVGSCRTQPWVSPAVMPLVASLSTRAVTTLNRVPAPSRFSQCTKPAHFGAERDAARLSERLATSFAPLGEAGQEAPPPPPLATHAGRHGLSPEQRECVVQLTSFDGRDAGAHMARALPPVPLGGISDSIGMQATQRLVPRPQQLLDDIEE